MTLTSEKVRTINIKQRREREKESIQTDLQLVEILKRFFLVENKCYTNK